MTHVSRVISFVAVGLLLAASAWAQATAQMTGTVRDESGAVCPVCP